MLAAKLCTVSKPDSVSYGILRLITESNEKVLGRYSCLLGTLLSSNYLIYIIGHVTCDIDSSMMKLICIVFASTESISLYGTRFDRSLRVFAFRR